MLAATIRPPADLRWEDILDGAERSVLHGDPAQPGAYYVVRFRTHREIRVPLHWHPEDEHITVLEGPFGMACAPAESDSRELPPGSYVVIPARVHHASSYGPGTVIQVSGIGPYQTVYAGPSTE